MKTSLGIRKHFISVLMLLAIVGVGVLSIIATGGGDDNGLSDALAPPLASKVIYGSSTPGGLLFQSEDNGTAIILFNLNGTYEKSSKSFTMNNSEISHNQVDDQTPLIPLLYDYFRIQPEETLQWSYNHNPAFGIFRVTDNVTFVRISVNQNIDGSNQPGVDLKYASFEEVFATSSLTWDEFKGILNDTASYEDYQVQAAYAYFILQTVYDHIQLGIDAVEYITLHDSDLEAAGSGIAITETCDLLASTGAQGDYSFSWLDGPGEIPGELGPGDDFSINFNNCWLDTAGTTTDTMFAHGGVGFHAYIEDQATAGLGFLEIMPNVYTTKTEENESGIPMPVSTVIVGWLNTDTGSGFNLFLTPDTSTTINMANIINLTESAIIALTLPGEIRTFVLDQLLNVAEGGHTNELCTVAGTASYVLMPPILPVLAGHSMTVVFDNCVGINAESEQITYNGIYTLSVDSLSGTLSENSDYNVTTTLSELNMSITDNAGITTYNGGMRFIRSAIAGNFTETSESVSTTPLLINEEGTTLTLSEFSTSSVLSVSSAYSLGAPGETVNIRRSDIADVLTLTINQPVQGVDLSAPNSGNLEVTATDGSTLSLIINSQGLVTIALDADGDGNVDDSFIRDWDDLY